MNTVLWIVAGLLALVFLGAGLMKALRPKEALATSGLAWVEDFSPAMVKTIGGLEVLAAIGLILPAVLDIAPVSNARRPANSHSSAARRWSSITSARSRLCLRANGRMSWSIG